jgi:hypothetical protein
MFPRRIEFFAKRGSEEGLKMPFRKSVFVLIRNFFSVENQERIFFLYCSTNTTTSSYNASVVKNFTTPHVTSLVRFEVKKYCLLLWKMLQPTTTLAL